MGLVFIGSKNLLYERGTKMKKLISVLLSVIMIVSMFSSSVVTAAAANGSDIGEVEPNYVAGDVWTSTLTFSGKTATCMSSIILASDERWVSINQRLEKQTSSGTWEIVSGASWNVMSFTNSNYYVFTNTKTVTSSGKYRVRSKFVVESPSGAQDTIIKYSAVVSI